MFISSHKASAFSKSAVSIKRDISATAWGQPTPAREAMFTIDPPSLILPIMRSVKWRRPMKLTVTTVTAGAVGGTPAMLHSVSALPLKLSTALFIDVRSVSSTWIYSSTYAWGSLRSKPTMIAPRSCKIFALCCPIPEATPVTIIRLPVRFIFTSPCRKK